MTKKHQFTLNMEVDVFDPQALWEAARDRFLAENPSHKKAKIPLIGTKKKPDLGACLIMLIDPGESPSGCSIIGTNAEDLSAANWFDTPRSSSARSAETTSCAISRPEPEPSGRQSTGGSHSRSEADAGRICRGFNTE